MLSRQLLPTVTTTQTELPGNRRPVKVLRSQHPPGWRSPPGGQLEIQVLRKREEIRQQGARCSKAKEGPLQHRPNSHRSGEDSNGPSAFEEDAGAVGGTPGEAPMLPRRGPGFKFLGPICWGKASQVVKQYYCSVPSLCASLPFLPSGFLSILAK